MQRVPSAVILWPYLLKSLCNFSFVIRSNECSCVSGSTSKVTQIFHRSRRAGPWLTACPENSGIPLPTQRKDHRKANTLKTATTAEGPISPTKDRGWDVFSPDTLGESSSTSYGLTLDLLKQLYPSPPQKQWICKSMNLNPDFKAINSGVEEFVFVRIKRMLNNSSDN